MGKQRGIILDRMNHCAKVVYPVILASMNPSPSADSRPGLLFRITQWLFLLGSRFTRGMTLGVRGMVIDAENRIFLVRHSYVRGWHMPGGGVEAGETLLEALAKELREEGNIVFTQEPRLIGIYLNRVASKRDHVAVYLLRDFEQTAPRIPDREIVETGFFPLGALPPETTQATRRRIAEALSGLLVTQTW
jgi:ADP-ribose pyrophosphatase YjhB (NUDIX family)